MGMVPADTDDENANRVLLEELQRLNEDLDVPCPSEYGISRERYMDLLPAMAEQAIASGSPGNNPRIPSIDEIVDLYQQVYCRIETRTDAIRTLSAGGR
jgi:alcohol dehydrogenase class IV